MKRQAPQILFSRPGSEYTAAELELIRRATMEETPQISSAGKHSPNKENVFMKLKRIVLRICAAALVAAFSAPAKASEPCCPDSGGMVDVIAPVDAPVLSHGDVSPCCPDVVSPMRLSVYDVVSTPGGALPSVTSVAVDTAELDASAFMAPVDVGRYDTLKTPIDGVTYANALTRIDIGEISSSRPSAVGESCCNDMKSRDVSPLHYDVSELELQRSAAGGWPPARSTPLRW